MKSLLRIGDIFSIFKSVQPAIRLHGKPNTGMARTLCATTLGKPSANNLVWIDLEMSGLDVDRDRILEIACIVTDAQLNVVAKGPDLIINEPDAILESMNQWCKDHHGKTGLTEAVRNSKISLQQAEQSVLEFVKEYCMPNACPLAGNSIYMDRLFLLRYMPTLNEYLHYRVVDVSTVKELCKRWNGPAYHRAPRKRLVHRALADIEDSIQEMQYYKDSFFVMK